MTISDPIRIGVIGAGYIAGVHGEAAAAIPGTVQIVAVADADPAAAERAARTHGWPRSYGDVAAMLAEEQLDAVIIATWPSTHLELIRQTVDAGIRVVLCEKPFVLTGEEALEVWALADQSGATIIEAFMYRHHPALDRIDQMLGRGDLGVLDHVRASFTYVNLAEENGIDPTDPNRPWRFRADQGGGALYDIGAYAINACTHVAGGLPVRVAAFGRVANVFGTSDKIMGLIDYDNEVVGMIEASEISETNQELQISGDRGTLHIPATWTIYDETEIAVRRAISTSHRDQSRIFRTLEDRFTVPKSNAFTDQLVDLAAVVRGRKAPRVGLAETVVNTITMEALATSLATREEIDVVIPDGVAAAFRATATSTVTASATGR
ncbi:MAG: Gfo/Idh/MocA family oxidoreductase [Herbiconiux sp.]|nr:Gfo/Idh/MocA family oxidoreductase [Herbiconiux sp.]